MHITIHSSQPRFKKKLLNSFWENCVFRSKSAIFDEKWLPNWQNRKRSLDSYILSSWKIIEQVIKPFLKSSSWQTNRSTMRQAPIDNAPGTKFPHLVSRRDSYICRCIGLTYVDVIVCQRIFLTFVDGLFSRLSMVFNVCQQNIPRFNICQVATFVGSSRVPFTRTRFSVICVHSHACHTAE